MESTKENWILIPVYNDWESLTILLSHIQEVRDHHDIINLHILIVDDASTSIFDYSDFGKLSVYLLRLRKNIGHQRAIATGLAFLHGQKRGINNVIVIDGDGEDDPETIPQLIYSSELNPGYIIFSSRTKRQESILFKTGYWIYKLIFRLLTGSRISYGNFSLLPGSLLSSVVNISDIWYHYSGGIMKAGLKYTAIPAARNKRYAGQSSMSVVALIIHGLKSIAVYFDKVAARLLIFFMFCSLLIGVGIFVVLYLKYFTVLAIPGWTTTALSGLLILLFQTLLISVFISFIVLNQNSQRHTIPSIDYNDFVDVFNQISDDK